MVYKTHPYKISETNYGNQGIGYPISIPSLYEHRQKRIGDSRTNSKVFVNTSVVQLIQERPGALGSRIVGAIIRREFLDGKEPQDIQVQAKLVTLATGGFQGSPSLTSLIWVLTRDTYESSDFSPKPRPSYSL